MKHIRYLNTAQPICDAPELLDEYGAFVIADVKDDGLFDQSCWSCSRILREHNQKYLEEEKLVYSAQQMASAVMVCSVFWVLLFIMLHFFLGVIP